jgi:hypothetical protein
MSWHCLINIIAATSCRLTFAGQRGTRSNGTHWGLKSSKPFSRLLKSLWFCQKLPQVRLPLSLRNSVTERRRPKACRANPIYFPPKIRTRASKRRDLTTARRSWLTQFPASAAHPRKLLANCTSCSLRPQHFPSHRSGPNRGGGSEHLKSLR